MSAKTVFAVAVALAAVWSAAALPLAVDDVTSSPANGKENFGIDASPSAAVDKQEPEQQTQGTEGSVLRTDGTESAPEVQQSSRPEVVIAGSEIPAVGTVPATPEVSDVKTESDVPTTATVEQPEGVTGTNSPSPVAETNSPSPVAGTYPFRSDAKPDPSFPVQGQRPKPYYTGGVQNVNLGPGIPFFLEFFQPFQSFQPFQPFASNHGKQPLPFGAPFDPFANPMRTQSINQMVDAYTKEFRNMLASLDNMGMPQMDNFGGVQEGSDKPVRKTTSKTEIIDGHRVQINETTVSNGDENHKSFYHFKEIQVLPEGTSEKMSNEKLISVANEDSETEKMETNEIKSDLSGTPPTNHVNDDRKNFIKKVE